MTKQEQEEWASFECALLTHLEAKKIGTYGLSLLAQAERDARAYKRIQERACSEDMSEASRDAMAAREKRIEERFAAFGKAIGAAVRLDGDPRGYTVKLMLVGADGAIRGNTFGGNSEGWGFPGS